MHASATPPMHAPDLDARGVLPPPAEDAVDVVAVGHRELALAVQHAVAGKLPFVHVVIVADQQPAAAELIAAELACRAHCKHWMRGLC